MVNSREREPFALRKSPPDWERRTPVASSCSGSRGPLVRTLVLALLCLSATAPARAGIILISNIPAPEDSSYVLGEVSFDVISLVTTTTVFRGLLAVDQSISSIEKTNDLTATINLDTDSNVASIPSEPNDLGVATLRRHVGKSGNNPGATAA